MMPAIHMPTSTCHILVVDDDPLIAIGLRLLFESQGMQVSTARNGREAADQLSATPFAAVLTDLDMPGGCGAALIGEIRRIDGERLPIILLTGDHQAADRLDGTGNVQILHKPAAVEQILAAMEQALQKAPDLRHPIALTGIQGETAAVDC
jgi:DNA-binding response OmpR family regulator